MKYQLKDKYLYIDINSICYETIQDFLDAYIPSKKIQHLLIQDKNILLDGNPCKREDYITGVNLMIKIYQNNYEYKKLNYKLDVIYEDEIILVVNKPKGLIVHSDGNDTLTLSDIVKSYYFDTPYIDVQAVNRLDEETSGLVMFSKSQVFQPSLDILLTNKQIRRSYIAFVEGIVTKNSFVVDKPIGKDRHNPNRRIVHENGQTALTKFKLLSANKKDNYSVLRCTLDTGRTHQIRVHLLSEGHPILNDELYGHQSKLLTRMGLIGDKLDFYHPLKEEYISIECDLPNDMNRLL